MSTGWINGLPEPPDRQRQELLEEQALLAWLAQNDVVRAAVKARLATIAEHKEQRYLDSMRTAEQIEIGEIANLR